MRRVWINSLVLFAALSLVGLGVRPLVVPDEPRYGVIPAEMLEAGNWFSPRMAGFVYYEKPPLGYWCTAASIAIFGHNAFAVRFPSAVATLAVALVVGWLAVRITGRRDAGPNGFLVQSTTLAPFIFGSVALLDPPFAAFVSLSMGALYCACTSGGHARARWLALAGIAAGLAFLTKGLLAFAIPAVSAVVFLVWERRWRDMLVMPWIPLAAATITVLPCVWMVHSAAPGFWREFIVNEHWRRMATPNQNQHPEAWWFFFALFPIGAMMWTLAWPSAWKGLRDATEWRTGIRFMTSWIIGPLVLLSMSRGKLPTYLLPLFAPAAVLVALGLYRARELGRLHADRPVIAARWMLRTCALVSFVIALVGADRLALPTLWESGESLRFSLIGTGLLLWAQLDGWSWCASSARTWLTRTAIAPVPILLLIPFLFPTALFPTSKIPWSLLQRHAEQLRTAALLVTSHEPAHALCWTTARYDLVIAGDPSEFDNRLDLESERARRIGWEAVAQRVIAARSGANPLSVSVLGPTRTVESILKQPELPPPDSSETDGDLTTLHWQ